MSDLPRVRFPVPGIHYLPISSIRNYASFVSSNPPGRSSLTVAMPPIQRGVWTQEEDDLLLSLVSKYVPRRWNKISDLMQTRTSKQCAQRYTQHLRKNLDHSPFSEHECHTIEYLVSKSGTCWAHIARHLVNRSESKIKNWWYNRQEKQRRRDRRSEAWSRYWMSHAETGCTHSQGASSVSAEAYAESSSASSLVKQHATDQYSASCLSTPFSLGQLGISSIQLPTPLAQLKPCDTYTPVDIESHPDPVEGHGYWIQSHTAISSPVFPFRPHSSEMLPLHQVDASSPSHVVFGPVEQQENTTRQQSVVNRTSNSVLQSWNSGAEIPPTYFSSDNTSSVVAVFMYDVS